MPKVLFLNRDPFYPPYLKEEHQKLIQKAELYLHNQIFFTHEWDMERCDTPYQFTGDWEVNPFGDPEWAWMLNRCRFIEELGLAYYTSQDPRYAYHAINLISDWIDFNDNPHQRTKSSWRRIDTGIRIVHWLKTIELIKDLCDKAFLQKLRSSLHQHGSFLVEGFSNTSLTSNWGVMEFYGLLCLSLAYDFSESAEWQKLALRVLHSTAHAQVFTDGVQWEQSPLYHNGVLHCYLHVFYLSQKFSIELSESFQKKIYHMCLANVYWQKPNGHQPLWGDSDDTSLGNLLSVAATLFQDGIFKKQEHLNLEHSYYLSSDLFEGLTPSLPQNASRDFPDGGFLVLKDHWEQNSSYLSLVTKNFGGGHSHNDLLHVSYYAHQKDYLIDCGRLTYTESSEREYLKSSEGHNAIVINHRENTNYKDSWSTQAEARFITGDWRHYQGIDWAYSHDISSLDQGVIVTRNLIKFHDCGFLLLDCIQCSSPTTVTVRFNTPTHLSQNKDYWSFDNLFLYSNRNGIIQEGFYSYHYNQKLPCYKLIQEFPCDHNTIIANLFSFSKQSSLSPFEPIDRKGRKVSSDKAQGFRFVINEEEYLCFYKIEPSASNSGFFLEWEGSFYLSPRVLLKKEGYEWKEIFHF